MCTAKDILKLLDHAQDLKNPKDYTVLIHPEKPEPVTVKGLSLLEFPLAVEKIGKETIKQAGLFIHKPHAIREDFEELGDFMIYKDSWSISSDVCGFALVMKYLSKEDAINALARIFNKIGHKKLINEINTKPTLKDRGINV